MKLALALVVLVGLTIALACTTGLICDPVAQRNARDHEEMNRAVDERLRDVLLREPLLRDDAVYSDERWREVVADRCATLDRLGLAYDVEPRRVVARLP